MEVIKIQRKLPTIVIFFLIISSLFVLDITRRYMSGDFADDDIELEVLYSSEKAGWLESIVSDFEAQWQEENPRIEIKVTMTPIGTAKGTIQIAQGASEPTIWSPASSFWLPLLNSLVEDSGQEEIVDVDNSPSAVVSPTVVATWQTYQEENNITSMEDFHDLALNDPDFTFAHTDPFASNGGYTGVIMQVAAAANKSPEELTLQDLETDQVHDWMREIQSSVIYYGSSTGFLGKFLASEGPDSLKAAIIYENLVVEKNRELEYRIEQGDIPEDQKLVAIYPEEGVLLNDHPFSIIDRPYVTEEDREVANEFIDFILQQDAQEVAVEYGFRPVVDVDQQLLDEQFNEENGVVTSFDELKIYQTSEMDGKVVQRIPDVWSATRSRSLNAEQSTGLTARDYVIPALFVVIFLTMVLHPIIKRIRRMYF